MGKPSLAPLLSAVLLLTCAITDSTGAAVPAAKVQIANVATNVQTGVTTNVDGTYQAPSLPAGTYTVAVSANGFKTARRNDVVLDVSQAARLDITLEVGAVSESVDVTAQAEVVDSTPAPPRF